MTEEPTRLERNIERLVSQKAVLDHVLAQIAATPGPLIELGLGNGRTFDHLRRRAPEREIFVFERDPTAHPNTSPDADHLIVGDFAVTLAPAAVAERALAPSPFVHADIGSSDPAASSALACWLAPLIPSLLTSGGWVACDQALVASSLAAMDPPAGMVPGRYFLYRHVA